MRRHHGYRRIQFAKKSVSSSEDGNGNISESSVESSSAEDTSEESDAI
ncbi:hypothetical protein PC123_g17335 [Phytophthora cactorum]|nr:hypothetical protein PC120_g19538 [Phytophthora cactorum]KAG4047314.1 hypothetical protein PC123_g17335 [Phytophthora cactorum]